MKQYRDEYISIMRDLDGDIEGREKALDYIEKSDVWVHGKPAPFPFVANFFDEDDMAFLENVCETTHGILTKVIERYLADEDYRKLFHFPAEVERLILFPCGYDEKLPMGRFDIFLDEADRSFKFCEFNTDGSGAMSRDLEIGRALMQSDSFKTFAKRHKVTQFELFDSWVEAFMENYRQWNRAGEHPTIAVTDFEESGVFSDFNRFIAAFERAGISARFVDVRSFEFDGEHLIDPSDGRIIDAIYRRAVTSEILQHPGECDAFIDAVAADRVCLIGHFRTTVVHSKMISIVLFDEVTKSFLSDEENAFIERYLPHTARLRSDGGCDIAAIKRDKDAWIIKPEDDYGAHGVYPGVDFEQAQWEHIVDENIDSGYVAQEFYPPHTVDIVLPEHVDGEDPCKVEAWQSMPGFYVYNGHIAGFYCREGQEGVIAIDHGGLCVPSFKIED